MKSHKNRKCAALIYGMHVHHLDHLAVVSQLMQMPLIVTEGHLLFLAKKYYPHLDVIFYDYHEVAEQVVKHYDVIFCTIARDLFEKIFFFSQNFLRKKIHSVWCPHGNSDKGHTSPFMEALEKEEVILVYGQKMIDFIKEKGVFDQLKAYVRTGNFRYTYYKMEKEFYTQILPLEKQGRTLLYAPTWEDSENSSTFFTAGPILLEHLPDDDFLIVKLHPNMVENLKADQLIWQYEHKKNVLFLKEYPPVYPLLDKADIYIGDMSSIGYDFLTFNRPMFFLNQNKRDRVNDKGLYLYRCGVEILPEKYKDIYKIIDFHLPSDQDDFSKVRQEMYEYTFGKEREWKELRDEIREALDFFTDPDLNFL